MNAEEPQLTLAELEGNAATQKHINLVRGLIQKAVLELLKRGDLHDLSKLEPPERTAFAEFSSRLSGVTFGSPEYFDFLHQMDTALKHHYAENRHHPQHFENGVDGMNLIDLFEMLLDWWASTQRHDDGNIMNSITVNSDRFGICPQLANIFRNTIRDLGTDQLEDATVLPKPPVSSVCNLDPGLSQPQSQGTSCDCEASKEFQTK